MGVDELVEEDPFRGKSNNTCRKVRGFLARIDEEFVYGFALRDGIRVRNYEFAKRDLFVGRGLERRAAFG